MVRVQVKSEIGEEKSGNIGEFETQAFLCDTISRHDFVWHSLFSVAELLLKWSLMFIYIQTPDIEPLS